MGKGVSRLARSVVIVTLAAGGLAGPGARGGAAANVDQASPSSSSAIGPIARISAGPGGQSNGTSTDPQMSASGRFVVFTSSASNLVASDTNNASDIFLFDRSTGALERVSLTDAGAQANGASSFASISDDGNLIAFSSAATNLLTGMTPPLNQAQLYLRDRAAGTTTLVSLGVGATFGDRSSFWPRISGNGSFVEYLSLARNLVTPGTSGTHVFVRDLAGGTNEVIDVNNAGIVSTSSVNQIATISADGRFVSFSSADQTIGGPGPRPFTSSVYLRDRVLRTTVFVATGHSPSLSADGRYLAFGSSFYPTEGNATIWVFDRATNTKVNAVPTITGTHVNGALLGPALSGDGMHVLFWSDATNVIAGDTNGGGDLFTYDVTTGVTTRVTVTSAGAQDGATSITVNTKPQAISYDGTTVAFESTASGLVANDTNGLSDVFQRDLAAPNTPPQEELGPDDTDYVTAEYVRSITFVDPDPGQTWTGTVDYGEGAGVQPLTISGMQFTLDHRFQRRGTYAIRVTITDSLGGVGSDSMTLSVKSLPVIVVPGLAGSELVATAGGALDVPQPDGSTSFQFYVKGQRLWAGNLEQLGFFNPYFNILQFVDTHPLVSDVATNGQPFTLQVGGRSFAYTDIGPFFAASGYIPGQDYFVYTYDWRFGVETQLGGVHGIDSFVDAVLATTGAPKVDIVAHSMGTLVTRNFLLHGSFADRVDHVILVGGPQLGAPKGSYALLRGTCLNDPSQAPFGWCAIKQEQMQFLVRNFPGVIENAVSPTYYAVYDGSDPNYPLPYRIVPMGDDPETGHTYADLRDAELMQHVNLTSLDFAEVFHADDATWLAAAIGRTAARVSIVAGTAQCTIAQISQHTKPTLNAFGVPIGVHNSYDYTVANGDGTVTLGSATLGRGTAHDFSAGVPVFYRNFEHQALVQNNDLGFILSLLRDESVSAGEAAEPFCPVFSAQSPMEFLLTDSHGRRVGSSDGATTFAETGSYDRYDDMKLAVLPADGDTYTAQLRGTGVGDTLLQLRFFQGGDIRHVVRFAHVPTTTATRASVSFDTTLGTAGDLSVDTDGDGTVDLTIAPTVLDGAAADDTIRPDIVVQAPVTGRAFVGGMDVRWTATDAGSGVQRSFAWLDRGATADSVLAAPGIMAVSPGTHTLEVFAEDRAGNVNVRTRTVVAYDYAWSAPLNARGQLEIQAGRTLPVRFTVVDSTGRLVADHSVSIELRDAHDALVAAARYTGNPSSGIDIDRNGYHADLTTRGSAPGAYVLLVRFDSPSLQGTLMLPIAIR